jgi:hypothetical protein
MPRSTKKTKKTVTMQDLGEAIGATPKVEKERRTVRVAISTMTVYPPAGKGANRIGSIVRYIEREGARTPSGGVFTAHRLTVIGSGRSPTKNCAVRMAVRP